MSTDTTETSPAPTRAEVTSQTMTDAARDAGLNMLIRTRSGYMNGGFSAASGFPAGHPSASFLKTIVDGKPVKVPVDTVEIAEEALLQEKAWTDRSIVGIIRAYGILFDATRAEGATDAAVTKSTGFKLKGYGWILPRGPAAIRAFLKAHNPEADLTPTKVAPRGLRILSSTKDVLLGAVAACRTLWGVETDAKSEEEFAARIETNAKGKEDAAAEREAAAAQREADKIETFSAHISVALNTAIMARVTAMDLDASDPRDRGIALEAIAGIVADVEEEEEEEDVLARADKLKATA